MNSKLFGIKIARGSRDELLCRARSLIGAGGRIATLNPIMMSYANENTELREALSGFELCIPDGVGVRAVLALRGEQTAVVAGVELGELLLDGRTLSLGVVGAKEGIARRAMDNLLAKHPQLCEAFVFDGYTFDEDTLAAALRRTRPSLAYFCLGTPKQELLIEKMYRHSPTTLFVGLGGSLDIYSGAVRRAPRAVRALGAEWLWRTLSQPSRLARLPRIFSFMRAALREE